MKHSTLPKSYSEQFGKMLWDVSQEPRLHNREFTTFWPMRGEHFTPTIGLMVVGRAVNKWTKESWSLTDLQNDEKRADLVQSVRELSESEAQDRWKYHADHTVNIRKELEIHRRGSACPLSWVVKSSGPSKGKYNTNRSQFWALNKRILTKIHKWSETPETWSSYMCWSNLYKVATYGGGNPTKRCQIAQRNACFELLRMEIEEWQPKYVLLLTGCDWSRPFLDHFGVECKSKNSASSQRSHVMTQGKRGKQTWIVAHHQQGRKLGDFTNQVVQNLDLE